MVSECVYPVFRPRGFIDMSISAALMKRKLSLSLRRSKDLGETPSPLVGTSVPMTSPRRSSRQRSPSTESLTTLSIMVCDRAPQTSFRGLCVVDCVQLASHMTECFTLFRMMLGISYRRFTSALPSDLSAPLHPICASRRVSPLRSRLRCDTHTKPG